MSTKYSNIDDKSAMQGHLNAERASGLIIERAKQLVDQVIEHRGHDKPPFLSEEFASLQNIKRIVKTDLGRTSAVLLRFHDGYVIKVNQNHHPVRQNFSIAHEIGHLLFDELKLQSYVRNIENRTYNPQATRRLRDKVKERLCEAAAAELLMPETVFSKYLANFGLSVNSIEPLAHVFRTSIPATAFRIAEVSTEPCLVLTWKPRPTTKPKGLRLTRCIGSGGKSKDIPVDTFVKLSSKIYEAFESNNSIKSTRFFKVNDARKRLPIESKGFSSSEYRYVLSLAFPDR
jgi:Zn-dependent peptidase ImmA (M78 family)